MALTLAAVRISPSEFATVYVDAYEIRADLVDEFNEKFVTGVKAEKR